MQEEVEQRTVTLIINCGKLTEKELRQAISQALEELKKQRGMHVQHGKMSVKDLAAQNKGMQSIEITDANIGAFSRTARKYGIDYAPYRIKGEKRHLVFFKAPDTDAMTAAFTEFTQKQVKKASRPSVLVKLQQFKDQIRNAVVDRTRKKELER